jgi:hypothetical protein
VEESDVEEDLSDLEDYGRAKVGLRVRKRAMEWKENLREILMTAFLLRY